MPAINDFDALLPLLPKGYSWMVLRFAMDGKPKVQVNLVALSSGVTTHVAQYGVVDHERLGDGAVIALVEELKRRELG